jgi:exopolysaccharide production protein ExoZ
MATTRINNLDYLRGLMALGIMTYHFSSWTFGTFESDTLLGIVGIYGVSIFYVLSGLTLYLVYKDSLTLKSTGEFFVKRIFRIYPLLWLSIVLTLIVVVKSIKGQPLLLNFTGAFGFLDPAKYITNGAWSIGNELVFYVIFPFVLLANRFSKIAIELFFIASLALGIYFAFDILSSHSTLAKQWPTYVNPFNQLFLFVGGVLIGKLINSYRNNSIAILLFAAIVVFLAFEPISGNQINIVTGWNRLLFSGVAFALTIAFFLFDYSVPKLVDTVLSKLGHISYSLYLLHAVVFWFVARYINRGEHVVLFFIVAMGFTIFLSYLSYNYFEVKFMRIGKNILKSKKE